MIECPYCPKTADGKHAVQSIGQHISQAEDHPDMQYPQARSRLKSGASADEWPGDTKSDFSASEPPDPSGRVEESDDTPPHHTSPAVHFDTDQHETGTCPECGDPFDTAAPGVPFAGKLDGEEVTGETERTDEICDGCGVLVSDDGTEIEAVEAR